MATYPAAGADLSTSVTTRISAVRKPTPLTASLQSSEAPRRALPPMHHHAELGERERGEDVDRKTERRASRHRRGEEQRGERRCAHDQHSLVSPADPKDGRTVSAPKVDGHVGEHARSVEKAGLGGDEQRRFESNGTSPKVSEVEAAEHPVLGHRVEEVALSVRPTVTNADQQE